MGEEKRSIEVEVNNFDINTQIWVLYRELTLESSAALHCSWAFLGVNGFVLLPINILKATTSGHQSTDANHSHCEIGLIIYTRLENVGMG